MRAAIVVFIIFGLFSAATATAGEQENGKELRAFRISGTPPLVDGRFVWRDPFFD